MVIGKAFALKGNRIWVAGHKGMVGRALCDLLEQLGCEVLRAGREDVDLTRQESSAGWWTTALMALL